MAINLKSIGRNPHFSVIKFSHENNISDAQRINCIYALNGGYNEVLRSVDFDKFKDIRDKYNDLLNELVDLLKNS